MPLKSTSEQAFGTVGVSKDFHKAIRQLSAAEGKRMWIILDKTVLPILKKRLARLTGKLSE